MIVNKIAVDRDTVANAMTEASEDERRTAMNRIGEHLDTLIRSAAGKALALGQLHLAADPATIDAVAQALVPQNLLKAAKAGRLAEHPASIVIVELVRAARDLRVPANLQGYMDLTQTMHLRTQQEEVRQLNVGRLPQGIRDIFSGTHPAPAAGSDFHFALKCTLISHILTSIAINELGRALKRSVAPREVLPVLWEEEGAVEALGIPL